MRRSPGARGAPSGSGLRPGGGPPPGPAGPALVVLLLDLGDRLLAVLERVVDRGLLRNRRPASAVSMSTCLASIASRWASRSASLPSSPRATSDLSVVGGERGGEARGVAAGGGRVGFARRSSRWSSCEASRASIPDGGRNACSIAIRALKNGLPVAPRGPPRSCRTSARPRSRRAKTARHAERQSSRVGPRPAGSVSRSRRWTARGDGRGLVHDVPAHPREDRAGRCEARSA